MGYGFLCGEREEGVCSAGEDCEAGCVVSMAELGSIVGRDWVDVDKREKGGKRMHLAPDRDVTLFLIYCAAFFNQYKHSSESQLKNHIRTVVISCIVQYSTALMASTSALVYLTYASSCNVYGRQQRHLTPNQVNYYQVDTILLLSIP